MIYVERALFLIGDPDSGKSTQMRSAFLDWRLGRKSTIPNQNNISRVCQISNERWLYFRLSSPHETKEDINEFFEKFEKEMKKRKLNSMRWNFASALQITPRNKVQLPIDQIIAKFNTRFSPERMRAIILSPNRKNAVLPTHTIKNIIGSLWSVDCEVLVVDATDREANGFIISDYFDFT